MNFKKIVLTFLSVATLFFVSEKASAQTLDQNYIHYFHGTGCPHCAVVDEFIEDNNYYENYPIISYDVYVNREDALTLTNFYNEYNIPSSQRGVPAMFFPKTEELIIGDTPIIEAFEEKADTYTLEGVDNQDQENNIEESKQKGISSDLTIIAVITGALVDSVNPCAFAVLLLLLSSILAGNINNKKRALKAGLLFAFSIFLSYLAMGLGLYKALNIGNLPNYFMKVIGVLAIIVGLLNIKDYINYGGGGFIMEVPQSWRPKMKELLARVTSPTGAFFIGFVISLFLLPCTSGPYIVVLGMLSQRHLFMKALIYLIIYNLIFITPMVIITLLVHKGMDVSKLEKEREKRLKTLHLIAGILILGIGVLVLLGII